MSTAKPNPTTRTRAHLRSRLAAAFTILTLLILAAFLALNANSTGRTQASGFGTPGYLPAVSFDPTNTPVPTPTEAPIPAVLAQVALPGAECPNHVQVNPVTGYAYVANHDSQSVSIVDESGYLSTLAAGTWPTRVEADPNSGRVFVTNLQSFVAKVYNGGFFVTDLPTFGEPYDVLYHPADDTIYISDIFGHVTIYDASTYQLIEDLDLESGWLWDLALDPATGRVYVANWEYGKVFTLEGTQVTAEVQAGWGVGELAVNPNNGYVYGAHSAPNEQYPFNISVMQDSQLVTNYLTGDYSSDVDVNPVTGLAYFTNPANNSVTILQGANFVATVPAGEQPFAVASNPVTGYTFVANRTSNSVSVYQGTQLVTTLPAGLEPISVAVDTQRNLTYVANRASHIECNDVGQCVTICDPYASVTIIR